MSDTANGCCDDQAVLSGNPKADRNKRRKPFAVITSLPDPLPHEVEDTDDLQKFFEKWRFVPFATTDRGTGHKLLFWYMLLAQRSPTHSACMNKKCTYAFGTAPTTIRAKNPEFDTGVELVDPTTADKVKYEKAFTEVIKWSLPVRQFHRQAGIYYQGTGNVWVELSFNQTAGQSRAFVKLHKPLHCLYLDTEPGQPRLVGISPIWTDSYLRKHEPRIVPIYPNFSADTDGTIRTMFHLKSGDNTWYGRPESEASDLNKYSEVQATFYRIRNAHGEFAGTLILELEEENRTQFMQANNAAAKTAGFDSVADRFQHEYTQMGDNPKQVLVMTRSFGAKPMFVFAVPSNTSQGYFKGIKEIDADQILITHETTKRFMSFDVATGFAQDAYLEDYVINMEPVINNFRETILIFTNSIISAVWTLAGMDEFNLQSIWFDAPISSQIEQFKKKQSAPVPGQLPAAPDPDADEIQDNGPTDHRNRSN